MKKLCSLLFSRYAISAITILLEIALLILLFLKASEVYYLVFIIGAVINLGVIVAIVNADANPEYKVSWIAVLTLLPYLGALLCVIFYERRLTKREIRIGREIRDKLNTPTEDEAFIELGRLDTSAAGKAMAIMRSDPSSAVYYAEELLYFPSGEALCESLLSDLKTARHYIFLEYFIVEDGEMWSRIHAILKEKARAGVRVRLLYDDVGCMGRLPRDFDKRLLCEGIDSRPFSRVTPKLTTVHNNRDHRKICVIDGTVAYTGGVNIADEYINEKRRFGHWKDGGVRIFGAAALGFVKLYLQNWSFNIGECEDFSEFLRVDHKPEGRKDGEFLLPFGSGPAPLYQRQVGKEALLNIIDQAERFVYITTPYLIVDFELTESLRGAAFRGVDVRIITPKIPDKRVIKVMTKSAYPYLMEAGVRIYEYTPGFIHEKLIVSDDKYAIIGSINLDYRSLAHHFECAVWIYSEPFSVTVRDGFMDTMSKSEEMSAVASRLTFIEWIVKCIVRFFAPLL